MRRRTHIALLTALALTATAAAQSPDEADAAPPDDLVTPPSERDRGVNVRLGLEHRITFRADFKDQEGDVAINRTRGIADLSGPLGDRTTWTLRLDGEHSNYNFDDDSTFVPGFVGEPFDDVYSVAIAPGFRHIVNDTWSVFAQTWFRISAETGADWDDALQFSLLAGVRQQINDDFALIYGGGFQTRLEDDPLFIPLLGVEWRINERVRLTTEALGLRLAADVHDDWTVSFAGRWESRDYRLDEHDHALSEGVIRDERVPLSVLVEWKPTTQWTIGLEAGAVIFQEYELHDADGDEFRDVDTDPAPFLGLRVVYRF